MATLVACLTTGKGSWSHVSQLIAQESWEQIFLITNNFGKEKYTNDKEFEAVVIQSDKSVLKLTEDIKSALEGKIRDTEVAVNFVSGIGFEHMAVLAALLQLGLGIRLVVAGKERMDTL